MGELKPDDIRNLGSMGWEAIESLMTPEGVLASSAGSAYGAIFGRDSLIVACKLLHAHYYEERPEVLEWVRTILDGLVRLQGRETVPESGEEPGKCIHEWRPTDHEHLTRDSNPPWYLYADGEMRNYQGSDETALLLLTQARYVAIAGHAELDRYLPSALRALAWVMQWGDRDGDGFTDYPYEPNRSWGGSIVQTWMDSTESLFQEGVREIISPIAAVEVQGYTHAALRAWSHLLDQRNPELSKRLALYASRLKKCFPAAFALGDGEYAAALNGDGTPVRAIRSNMAHLLWADGGSHELTDLIIDDQAVELLVRRLMRTDLFDPRGGLRTLSKTSPWFDLTRYSNGAIWPHDTGMAAEGLERSGYTPEANKLRVALGRAIRDLGSPYEYYTIDEAGCVAPGYEVPGDHPACAVQAWTAATLCSEMAALRMRT